LQSGVFLRKTPLNDLNSALHQLENSYSAMLKAVILYYALGHWIRSFAWRNAADSSGLTCIMKGEPVISPPAECAAHRPQRKHGKQAVEWARFSLFKICRVTAGTFVLQPNYIWQPCRPSPVISMHYFLCCVRHCSRVVSAPECVSSHASRVRTLPVASATQKSAAP
jgi:hypothetical protein